MRKKTRGKAVPNKSVDVSLETELDGKQSVKVVFARETAKNLTMLDIIGLAVLTVFQPALFRDQPTGDDSLRQRQGENQETLDKY